MKLSFSHFAIYISFLFPSITLLPVCAQQTKTRQGPVYVDQRGVLRWKKNNTEAAFFGVNYTTPFAYGYRAHKVLNTDLRKAIDQDVYHFARLGLDAFRVHIWDTEITDSVGNLLENEHLQLYDYLLYQLKQRNIKIFLTPIAFWGNGYPEKDERTLGFSSLYNKQQSLVDEKAIQAQEHYVKQLLKHTNPYTGLKYGDDPDIIAAEINNEPHHSGDKTKATAYVNRLAKAIRSTGWTKPVFYNISESPAYADAVAKADIDGVSMQWYPTGLVANRTLRGNHLPHVDEYHIPFDTIAAFANKARMVYEFDAGDVLQPVMYPMMAKSFRQAGFQWATQFAYDPLATAFANTEYQTHYLNLAYTPAKAISLLIASKAFHVLPRLKHYGHYPADSVFHNFRVSYEESLAEMNSAEAFYYSGNTRTVPVNAAALKHLAGVGSSPVVTYEGHGAYFLDKLENGVWRLEVMPDAFFIRDPFEKASLSKAVSLVQWQTQSITIKLPDLGAVFTVKGINAGNNFAYTTPNGHFNIQPGTYLLLKAGKNDAAWKPTDRLGAIRLGEFVAPQPLSPAPYIVHEPLFEVNPGKSFTLTATVAGSDTTDKVTVEVSHSSGAWKTVSMTRKSNGHYHASVPADLVTPGVIRYRMIVARHNNAYYTFPGNHQGNPYAWDNYIHETWQTLVASAHGNIEIFNATHDTDILIYPNLWRKDEKQILTTAKQGQLILKLSMKRRAGDPGLAFQRYFADKLRGRISELGGFSKLVIRAGAQNATSFKLKVTLINAHGAAFAAYIDPPVGVQDVEIPFGVFKPDSSILLPRPYPGFQHLWFTANTSAHFDLRSVEHVQVALVPGQQHADDAGTISLEVERIVIE